MPHTLPYWGMSPLHPNPASSDNSPLHPPWVMSQCPPAAWCLGGPAGAWCSSLSRSQSQCKVPVEPCPTVQCQSNAGPSASAWKVPVASARVQVCRCWSQFYIPAGGAGVRATPAPHSCSLPRMVPAPVPTDGPVFWMIPDLGAWAMLDVDPGSQQGSQFTRLVPSSRTSASWRRSHFPLPGAASPHSQW